VFRREPTRFPVPGFDHRDFLWSATLRVGDSGRIYGANSRPAHGKTRVCRSSGFWREARGRRLGGKEERRMTPLCEFLEWDTRFFGVRVARVVGRTLDDENARSVLNWCEKEQIDCLYFLADANSEASVSAAEKYGFSLKDVRITCQKKLDRT